MTNYTKSASLQKVLSLQNKLLLLLLIFSMIPVFFLSKSVFTALAQRKDSKIKMIKKMNFSDSFVKEPIEIIEVRSNGKVIKLDENFEDENWLKDFTIKFKNISGKTITSIDLNLLFPETATHGEPWGVPTSYSLNYGLSPTKHKAGAVGMKILKPDEIDETALAPTSFATLQRFVAIRSDLSNLTTANLTVVAVEFDDGTHWSAGDIFRPDPNRPGKFVVSRDN